MDAERCAPLVARCTPIAGWLRQILTTVITTTLAVAAAVAFAIACAALDGSL